LAEKALAAVVQEAYVHGVSTRSVDDLVKAMGMTGISQSQVSRLCAEIDEKVKAFLSRPFEGDWPYLWIDATYVKVRESGRIVSAAVIVAVGVNSDDRREVLGMAIGPSEAEPFWTEFLRKLARRGLRGIKLVISDAHEGIKAAVGKVLHASWQRCRVESLKKFGRTDSVIASDSRSAGAGHAGTQGAGSTGAAHHWLGRQGRRVVAAFIGAAFVQDDAEAARTQWLQVADQLRPKVPKLVALMDEAEADVLAFMTFPKDHRPENPLHRSARASQCRDQAAYRRRRHLPQRGRHHAPDRRVAARTDRRMRRSARQVHEPGNDRAFER
jgi:transposase-like protein